MKRSLFVVCSLVAMSGVSAAVATERVLALDPGATKIAFQLQATGHDVEGLFALREGQVRIEPATGRASGSISVDTTAAGTGNDKRDKTMHAKVLESSAYPLFVYRVERVEGSIPAQGEGDLTLHGTLQIHGAEHPLAMPTHVQVAGEHVKATSEFTIPYVEWGLHDPSVFVLRVAKEVQVTVAAEGTLSADPAAR